MYKERQKAANVKTIKKVVEAKARKKRKAMKKMENARKAAEGVLSQDDVTTKEKMAQVKRIYRKAGAARKEKELWVLNSKKNNFFFENHFLSKF